MPSAKPPRPVLADLCLPTPIQAFAPNRDSLGGTAYFLPLAEGNLVIDCPAWDDENCTFLTQQGGIRWLVLTHRGAIGKAKEFQQRFNCEIWMQEQEAYLLPNLPVMSFQQEQALTPDITLIWTAGHSPGSTCVHYQPGGGILFSGRHLLPDRQAQPLPLRTSKTFHWPRQIRNVQALLTRLSPETLSWICPGANTGFLRGNTAIAQAYEQLARLDFSSLLHQPPGL
ncbi:MAG: MBL fold metallo-hydrolase [Synechococcales bacterium]|nr:MBL fold metallo-hydrolase [Synechococcales bacterium]